MANVGLYRSNRQNMIAGVMGGIAERFGWNATLLRIIFILVSVMSAAFPGILVYLILWLVIPKQQNTMFAQSQAYNNPIRTVNSDQNR
ncbi:MULTISPECIES: PspC domain-containing protein [unclassified Acinetobacter]|jgi:phage shock protein PspC (stress-responsive transcriptional regulator)|uniref:PspC domain-containing protein n=1 Tax=unclassified Acinetobacter TaxID=196816 RepID=UPI001ED9CFAB|nr:PspC domain-containing protein [Acinetobacter sp. SM34]MCG2608912.1 PspC domain-containing protein [Acinetobacter sp. SM34]